VFDLGLGPFVVFVSSVREKQLMKWQRERDK